MYCPNCGKQLPDNTAFCTECGAKIVGKTSGASENQQQNQGQYQQNQEQYQQNQEQYQQNQEQYQQNQEQYQQNQTQYQPYPPYNENQMPYVQYAYYTPVKKKRGHGLLITLISLILVGAILFTGFVTPGFIPVLIRKLTPMPDCFINGADVTEKVPETGSVQIGSAEQTGYTLTVPAGTLPDDSAVNMRVLSGSESEKLATGGKFTPIGTAVELTSEQYDGGLFETEVELEIRIPDRQYDENASAADYVIMYLDETSGEWVKFAADWYDRDTKTLHATIPHFSLWIFGKPTKEEQIEGFLDSYSREAARKQYDDEQAANALVPYISESLKGVDMTQAQRGELSRSLAVYLAAQLDENGKDTKETSMKIICAAWKAAETGDAMEFTNAVGDTLAEKLTGYLLDSGKYVPEAAPGITKVVGASSTLSKAAGYAAGGDYRGAVNEVTDLLLNATPQSALINAATKYIAAKSQECYRDWKANQIEELYQIYKNGKDDIWGNHVDAMDEESLWEYINYPHGFTKVAGVYRIYQMDSIAEVCKKYGWSETDYKQLSPEKKAIFEQRAKDGLMNYFRTRQQQETIAERIKNEERDFITELSKNTSLLGSYKYEKFFGEEHLRDFDLTKRLAKIYEIRELSSVFVDEKKFDRSGVSRYRLVEKWVELFEKYDESTALAKYLEYLKQEKILKDEFNVPEGELTLNDISGYWNLNMKISNIRSDLTDQLTDLFGSGAVTKYYDEDTEYDLYSAMEIRPVGSDRAEVGVYRETEDDLYIYDIYSGTYKDGELTLRLKERKGSYPGEDPLKLDKLTFTKNGDVCICAGGSEYKSFLASYTITFSGNRTEPLE